MKITKLLLASMCLCSAFTASAAPIRQQLHEGWQFRQARLNNWYPAQIPGVSHTVKVSTTLPQAEFERLLQITNLQQTR